MWYGCVRMCCHVHCLQRKTNYKCKLKRALKLNGQQITKMPQSKRTIYRSKHQNHDPKSSMLFEQRKFFNFGETLLVHSHSGSLTRRTISICNKVLWRGYLAVHKENWCSCQRTVGAWIEWARRQIVQSQDIAVIGCHKMPFDRYTMHLHSLELYSGYYYYFCGAQNDA